MRDRQIPRGRIREREPAERTHRARLRAPPRARTRRHRHRWDRELHAREIAREAKGRNRVRDDRNTRRQRLQKSDAMPSKLDGIANAADSRKDLRDIHRGPCRSPRAPATPASRRDRPPPRDTPGPRSRRTGAGARPDRLGRRARTHAPSATGSFRGYSARPARSACARPERGATSSVKREISTPFGTSVIDGCVPTASRNRRYFSATRRSPPSRAPDSRRSTRSST